jgi:hypothetical protein
MKIMKGWSILTSLLMFLIGAFLGATVMLFGISCFVIGKFNEYELIIQELKEKINMK